MATNKSMIEGLERMHQLIGKLKTANMNEMVDVIEELDAWNSVLKNHVGAQKRQQSQYWGDKYEYNEKTGKVERVYNDGEK